MPIQILLYDFLGIHVNTHINRVNVLELMKRSIQKPINVWSSYLKATFKKILFKCISLLQRGHN